MSDNPVTLQLRREMTAKLREGEAAEARLHAENENVRATLKLLGGPLGNGLTGHDLNGEPIGEDVVLAPGIATIPDLILAILARRPQGAGASYIIGEINKSRPTKGTSIYPSLLKMSERGSIRRAGSGRAAIYFPVPEK